MNDDFTPFELAVKLEEKGFNESCYGYYHCDGGDNSFEVCGNGDCDFLNSENKHRIAAPTISQVLKWLRVEKKIYLEIGLTYTGFHCTVYRDVVWDMIGGEDELTYKYHIDVYSNSKTTEQAALAGIEYVLDNLI